MEDKDRFPRPMAGQTVFEDDENSGRYVTVDHGKLAGGMGVGFDVESEEKNPFSVPLHIVQRNNETLNFWLPEWLKGMAVGMPFQLQDFDVEPHRGIARRDANATNAPCDAELKDRAIIVAAGPSLEKYLPFLKLWKGIIICGATTACMLLAHGVKPHYVFALDSNKGTSVQLQMAPMIGELGSKLVVPVTADYDTLRLFRSENRYWFKPFIQGAQGLNHPYNLFISLLCPWVEAFILQGGCVTNAAMLYPALLAMNGIADIRKLFLFGADFGYGSDPENPVSRTADFRWIGDEHDFSDWQNPKLWQRNPVPDWRVRSLCAPMRAANGHFTDEGMLGYKRSMYTLWEMQFPRDWSKRKPGDICMYSCSDGILFELPKADGMEVLRTQGECVQEYDYSLVRETYEFYINNSAIVEGQLDAQEMTEEEKKLAPKRGSDSEQPKEREEGDHTP